MVRRHSIDIENVHGISAGEFVAVAIQGHDLADHHRADVITIGSEDFYAGPESRRCDAVISSVEIGRAHV